MTGGSSQQTLQLSSPVLLLGRYCGIVVSVAAFTSSITYTAEQIANSPPLEPAFEHLLRNATVHESVVHTLRVNAITDRETFVNMFDAEAALKEGASDLGFNLSTGGLPHKREFARVVSAWKTAKIVAETKLQTDAVARAHGVPVTLLPCDWTSILTEFKKKYGSHIADDRLPKSTFKAEPLSHVVSLFEEEQQDLNKPEPARQYNFQLDSRLTTTTKRRHLSTEPTDEKKTSDEECRAHELMAACPNAAAGPILLQGF